MYCCHAIWHHAGAPSSQHRSIFQSSKHHVQADGALMSADSPAVRRILSGVWGLPARRRPALAGLHSSGVPVPAELAQASHIPCQVSTGGILLCSQPVRRPLPSSDRVAAYLLGLLVMYAARYSQHEENEEYQGLVTWYHAGTFPRST